MWTASAPLALRFAGIAWPLGRERVTLTLAADEDPRPRVTSARGWALRVDPDLPPPAEDEGPLAPVARALRDLRRAAARASRSPAPRRGAWARRPPCAGPPSPPWPTRRAGPRRRPRARSSAREAGAPADDRGPVVVATGRLAWLSARLVLFDDPFVPPAPPHADHATGEVDPRLVLEAEPSALVAALTGHGVPDRPVWREERLDRALREAGLLGRFRVAPGVGLAFVEPGRRRELEAALTAHGLAPAPCELGGPGVESAAQGA
ncbi:MAG: hypothetical protein M9894_18270 [Planctomycetes bacterium]|nr:hypothetical protein [Planctomycetota bacterium]